MRRAIAALFVIACTAAFGQPLEFEAASVRPHAAGVPGATRARGGIGTDDPERIAYSGFTLGALLDDAFNLKPYRLSGPDWLNADQYRYDVEAKIPKVATKEQFRSMLQHLLVERFQITLHWETKEVAAYNLVVGKAGLRINRGAMGGATEGNTDDECLKAHLSQGPDVRLSVYPKGLCFVAVRQPIARLADFLSGTLARPVADNTGLSGLYDYALFYSTDGTIVDRTIRPDSEGAPM